MHKINVDLDACESCRKCVDVCFLDVFRWNDAERKPVVAYPEDCVWCMACAAHCPAKCIEIIPTMPSGKPIALKP